MRLAALGCLLLIGCRASSNQESENAVGTSPISSLSSAPVDHLRPGELREGKERIFGFPLPADLHVDNRFVDVAYTSGNVTVEAVSNYIRARVGGGNATVGAARTVFRTVKVAAQPGVDLDFDVQALENGRRVRLEIRNVTAPPASTATTDEGRWNAAGFKPNGTLLDPKKNQ